MTPETSLVEVVALLGANTAKLLVAQEPEVFETVLHSIKIYVLTLEGFDVILNPIELEAAIHQLTLNLLEKIAHA